jgi:glycosyltransferase involved in cell wall biosynthesis
LAKTRLPGSFEVRPATAAPAGRPHPGPVARRRSRQWPLVSVITPTWGRPGLLLGRCLPSVSTQTWPSWALEHIVVSDGPDPWLAAEFPESTSRRRRLEQLPTHDPAYHWGHRAKLRGLELARGELIAYLDDDNAYRPRHLELVAGALLLHGADFAYSRMEVRLPSGGGYLVGRSPPECNHIDTSLLVHRRELLERSTWENADDGRPTVDCELALRWVDAGARWVHVPEVTVDYYARPAGAGWP